MNKIIASIVLALTLVSAAGISYYVMQPTHRDFTIPKEGGIIEPSDYSDRSNWLSLPEEKTKDVDVFYIYPTVWTAKWNQKPLSDITNAPMRKGAKTVLSSQAMIFDGIANIYAPYYRQLDAAYVLSRPVNEQEGYFKGVPKTDIIAAFDYYIRNHNNNRPFILMGHSQGAVMVKEILFDYLKEHEDVKDRMIAAYVIGYSVTKNELEDNPHVKFAENANDIGVIISYNTEAPIIGGRNLTVLDGSIAINPISWTRTDKRADASQNLGSMIDKGDGYEKITNLADARVNLQRGTVICSSIDPDSYSMPEAMRKFFPRGIYHKYDIALYYYNLRDNAKHRIDAYFKEKKSKKRKQL